MKTWHTVLQIIGQSVKHVCTHISTEVVVCVCSVLGRDKDRNTLSSSQIEAWNCLAGSVDLSRDPVSKDGYQAINVTRLTYAINFNDIHGVIIDADVEHGEARHVDESKSISLSRLEGQTGVCIIHNQTRVGNGFSTSRVVDTQEIIQ